METKYYDTFEIVKDRFLPYLWGMETKWWWLQHSYLGRFLPYLWGMETVIVYHTPFLQFLRSYRTYEEWKPGLSFEYVSYNSSSYRTYEEWKREIAEKQEEIDKVLTVPMRNGNYSGSSMSNNSSSVLTVPMRNGNRYQLQMPTIVGKFLPYLWGMETCDKLLLHQYPQQFLPYLWGMETL